MDCEEFLNGYSEYTDGLRAPEQLRGFEHHLRSCPTCARYDRVVKQGTDLLRNLPRPGTSADFLPRLRHRLYHIDDHTVLGSRLGGSAALIAVAAVGLLAVVWLPFASRIPVEVELAPVAVTVPVSSPEVPSLFSSGPFVTPVAFEEAGVRTAASIWEPWPGSGELFRPGLVSTGLSVPETDPSR